MGLRVRRDWTKIIDEARARSDKIYYIRTSDRIGFRGCRRAWNWASSLTDQSEGLEGNEISAPLWLGTGIHEALEDVHGARRFESAGDAFLDYYAACEKRSQVPDNGPELKEQGLEMLAYYELWLAYPGRPHYGTFQEEGQPCVEASFEIPLPYRRNDSSRLGELMDASGVDLIVYRGSIDRIGVDEYRQLWVFEYKSVQQFGAYHYLDTDPQVTAYLWAARILWPDQPWGGVIFQQNHKNPPKPPRVLSNGKLSTAATQNTSGILYRQKLEQLFGSVERAPHPQQEYYGRIMIQESDNQDRGVRWDMVTRSKEQLKSEEYKMSQEISDMMVAQGEGHLYPNPAWKCKWCAFSQPCVAMDSGYDHEQILKDTTKTRTKYQHDRWLEQIIK